MIPEKQIHYLIYVFVALSYVLFLLLLPVGLVCIAIKKIKEDR